MMATTTTKQEAKEPDDGRQDTRSPGDPLDNPAAAPGYVPEGSEVAADVTSQHLLDYCDSVEAELKTLEQGISDIRSAAKGFKSNKKTGNAADALSDFRNLIFDVLHSVPLLRGVHVPVGHVESRTLPGPRVPEEELHTESAGIGVWAGNTH
jgi:hypothetical protein